MLSVLNATSFRVGIDPARCPVRFAPRVVGQHRLAPADIQRTGRPARGRMGCEEMLGVAH